MYHEIKLGDFRTVHDVNQIKVFERDNEYYQPPEIINQQIYDVKIDVWAACVVIFILLTSEMPNYTRKRHNDTHIFKYNMLNTE